MATQERRAAPGPSANGKLPPLTVAKFEEAMFLLERVVEEKAGIFVENAAAHREKHREATTRPLDPQEAAQVAVAMSAALDGEDPLALAEKAQESDLRAYDEPDEREVLLAAGVATAPAFLDVALRLVALVEMPDGRFQEAHEVDGLDDAIGQDVETLRTLDLSEARTRASRAFTHFGETAGVGGEGKVWGTIARAVMKAMEQALTASRRSSSTSSLVSTDGTESESSTGSPTETPAS